MMYPFWDAAIGYGILMGVIAVVHVFISHFAIGGGLYLVVTEHRARRAGDADTIDFLEKLSRFFVLVTLVMGALTGVAIWFIIGLLAPAATEALIHNYVWAWATEWTFFVVEFMAAILYYYGWRKMTARAHLTLGWIYFIAAWLSLVVINGIITFMLTPGTWLETGNFWDGFFNPTYWPSLVIRTGITVMLASLYALLVVSRYKAGEFKTRTVRYTAMWGLIGLAVMAVAQFWYWKAIPAAITNQAKMLMQIPMVSLKISLWLASALVVLIVLFGFLAPRRLRLGIGIVLMMLGLAWFGCFEWFRESIRKPFVISGYIYGNGIPLAQAERLREDGYLAHVAYRTGDDGADLFRHACRSCHTLDGYHPLKPAFDGTDTAFIAAIIRSTDKLAANMPPFLGTDAEADAIAAHIAARVDQRPLNEVTGLEGEALGAMAYAVRCGICHVIGGYQDKAASFAGLSAEDIDGMLEVADSLGEGMPAYTGGESERRALVAFLVQLGGGVQP